MQKAETRRFDVALSRAFATTLGTYALVFRHLIERVGVEETTAIWDRLPAQADALTQEILEQDVAIESEPLGATETDFIVRKLFARPIQGFRAEQVTAFLRSRPPFVFIDEAFPTTLGVLSLTTYQMLHLSRDALARIAEEIIARFGKAGELMIYDALLADPDTSNSSSTVSRGVDVANADLMASRVGKPLIPSAKNYTPSLDWMSSFWHDMDVKKEA